MCVNLSQHDLDLWLPSSLPVSLTSKLFLRRLFENPSTLFRIIAYNPRNGQVRPITSLYKLLPVEEVVSSDVRTHQLEIAFSAPEEQALCEECPRRMECCVYDPDDEVLELDFIPELTPEEKDALRESGLDLIREYIPDSPVYNPEDEPGQYNLPYVPHSPGYKPPSPKYTPSVITSIPGLDEPEEGVHIKFADSPASPPPNGDVSMDVSSSGQTQLHTASMHPISDAAIILHPEPSGPPQGMPIPVHISRGIPPELMSDTDLDEELQHPDHPIEDYT